AATRCSRKNRTAACGPFSSPADVHSGLRRCGSGLLIRTVFAAMLLQPVDQLAIPDFAVAGAPRRGDMVTAAWEQHHANRRVARTQHLRVHLLGLPDRAALVVHSL